MLISGNKNNRVYKHVINNHFAQAHNRIVKGWEAEHVERSGWEEYRHVSGDDALGALGMTYAGCSGPNDSLQLWHGNRSLRASHVFTSRSSRSLQTIPSDEQVVSQSTPGPAAA